MKTFKKIKKLAIANRGEIAVRLVSACKEMGIAPVLLYSAGDKGSKAYRESPERICIGPADPRESYLNVSSILEGALSAGADALHPGYGFLSENADLALSSEENQLSFIGPSVSCLKLFGDKIRAREQAQRCGLPVLPAYRALQGENEDVLLRKAEEIGFPLMIKSLYGGGGRGLRVVSKKEEWKLCLESAKREAGQAVLSNKIFIEKYLPQARHIEIQVFGDASGRVFSLMDRDCSIQRRHQKVIESAPADIPINVKKQMISLSEKLLKSVDYIQAGTVEFLYHSGDFYFIEVNPRIQVECPVTEMILGVDLIKAQILTAQGHSPFSSMTKEFLSSPRGFSLQCRIYAEDVRNQSPVFGVLGDMALPHGPGRRFDMGYDSGDIIPEFYDSMLGKVIVYDEERARAFSKMKQILDETIIFGVKTNICFLQALMAHRDFLQGAVNTKFVEEDFLPSWKPPSVESLDDCIISSIRKAFKKDDSSVYLKKGILDGKDVASDFSPWRYFFNEKN